MNQAFKDCLERGQITKDLSAKKFVAKELKEADEDLQNALASLEKNETKWATIQAYYAGFHAVWALLFSRGFRERSHYCLIKAMYALFVDGGPLDARLIKLLEKIKALREKADYELEHSRPGAEKAIEVAKELVQKAGQIVAENRRG